MKKLTVYLLLFLFSNNSFAIEEYAFTSSEAMRLPPFCRGLSIENFQDDAKHLKKNIKVPGQHTQHFCHGMKALLRQNYKTAIGEFEYVQTHSNTKHVLIPSTSLYKAEALGMLGKTTPALAEYNNAIKLKKNYPHAYAKLANYYLKIKQPQNAVETIKLGLKFSPNSKLLKKRLQKIKKYQ